MTFFEEEITSISYNCDDGENESCDLVECGVTCDNDNNDYGHDHS